MEYLVVLLIFVVFLQTRIMELRRAVYCLAAQSGIIAGACLVIGIGAGGGLHALLPGLLTLLVKVLFIPGAMLRLIGRITDAREIYSDINVNYSTLAAALFLIMGYLLVDRLLPGAPGRSIIAESFVDDVLDVLGREDVRPEHIGIEITETAFMSNMAEASRAIAALSEQGIKIYLDDFGTGYSSLYYLHTLPIASLKIDKSFIDGINAPENASNELVKTVLTLASGLGMATVAEGVETREQAEFLAENGCKVIQGYLFSPAINGSAFAEYLKESHARIAAALA